MRRAGAAHDESGGGRLSVQSFSTSMGIHVGTSFQRTQGPPATPCPPRSKQWVNGIRIVELQAGVRPPFSWSAACLLVLFFWRAPSMAAPMGWRVLPSLVVLGLPLPLPRLSRRDRLKLGLALCLFLVRARARDLRSPNNVQVAAFPTEYYSTVIIASISIMSYQDLRKSQSTI